MRNIIEKINSLIKEKKKFAVCTIITTKGSVPRHVGTKMIVLEDSKIVGTIGGGAFEKKVIENALEVIKSNKPELFKHDLLQQHGMCCGGYVEIFIEPVMKNKKLYIFGAGHTGQALAGFAENFDFDVFLIDDRKEYLDSFNSEKVNKMNLDHNRALKALTFDDETFIVIVTYEHKLDRDILSYCIHKPFAYLGMIGSDRKIKFTRQMFLEGNLATEQELEKVNMPVGIEIGAESPGEIAISILAELIKFKNQVKK
jgi:xanthine dehydrogenase accessory factor